MGMQAGGGVMANINITPLVDVMLVLLIIFMVAAPVMEKERAKKELQEDRDNQQRLVALNLPALDNTGASGEKPRTLTLKVSSKLVVSFEGKQIADCSAFIDTPDKRKWQKCLDDVERAVLGTPEAKENGVLVDAEPEVRFGFVVGIMHRLHRANVEKVSMFPKTASTSPSGGKHLTAS
ncbi:MAG: biopolymer transporter ExbD [Proteobacteria bacterium]|nr:biopolymer transporter ExbD [Pseudomonadota bacterium]MBQ9242626.1 biopolymer transporter ExbD [Pseudomonadota bacterium]